MNNWKKLEKEIIAERKKSAVENTKNSLAATTGFFKFAADMLELFFPGMVKAMLGADDKPKQPQ